MSISKKLINSINNYTNFEISVDEDLIGGCSYDKYKVPITDR